VNSQRIPDEIARFGSPSRFTNYFDAQRENQMARSEACR
jgi:hypothetical protein